jgi:arabinofuranan 3-O-arabinosyltransferase
VLCYRYLDAREAGRLDDGIDPAWLADKTNRANVEA